MFLLVAGVNLARADNFSFAGNLVTDDQVLLFDFTVGDTSTITLRTWSYAGGVNAAGDTIASGGFDPILALFDSSGALIGQNDDGGGLVPADAVTGAHYDTYFEATVGAGVYTASVSQYNNFAIGPNLSNGFGRAGQPNFTHEWALGPGYFWDVTGHQRDGHWAFDILNVESAVGPGVPEPGSLLLLAGGLAGLLLKKRR